MPDSAIEILIGTSWQVDIRALAQVQTFSGSRKVFDYADILDTIDIVVDGNNLTAKLPEESIFLAMSELIGGLTQVWEGLADKHILAFNDGAFELVMQRVGEGFELSFYSTEPRFHLYAHNLPVNPATFLSVAGSAASQLVDDLLRINLAFAQETLVKGLRGKLRKLRHRDWPSTEPQATTGGPGDTKEVSVAIGDRVLGMVLTFDGSHPDYWRYQGTPPCDLHSLLMRGTLDLTYWGRRRRLAEGAYLFPLLEELVAGAEHLIEALQRRRGGAAILDDAELATSLLTAELIDEKHLWLRVTAPGPVRGGTRCSHEAAVSLLLDTAMQALCTLSQLNPRQQLNERLGDLMVRVTRAFKQFNTQREGNIYCHPLDQWLTEPPRIEPLAGVEPAPGGIPHPLGSMRHLFLRSAWFLARRDIDLEALTLVGTDLLVPSHRLLECVDRQDGGIRFRVACDRFLAASPRAALVVQDSSLVALDLAGGRPLWTTLMQGFPGPGMVYLRDGQPIALVTMGPHSLASVEIGQGRLEWTFDVDHAEISGLCWAGPALSVVADDGHIYGLRPDGGELLWRHHIEDAVAWLQFSWGESLCVCTDPGSGDESIAIVLSGLTGRKIAEHRLPSIPLRPPMVLGSMAVFLLEPPGTSLIMAVDLQSWRVLWTLPLESPTLSGSVVSWFPCGSGGLLVVKTERGACLAVDPLLGRPVWASRLLEPNDLLLHNVEMSLVEQHLIIPERYVSVVNPLDGRRLHRFTDLPEHPSALLVDGNLRLILTEGTDHLECFDLKGFLALL